ncbi:NUDIX domain-containing protein [Litorilinea aerophila]|uniref:NUDIX domain-containing protein n=1 Tax=Litorilinea aerophila TaxID=1204385 RepID=A0A540VHH4_9CHLR|nr:NUDIX domain-containing protein [Litorilinea aerophila]MCC9076187.1 NUDIX domain-containing protein [Litorilinea aerophila]GIV78887.1 MAG: 7,8-dihydro-8-oxoguanine triphosphatase [Litorilinea sp.]
MNVSEQGVPGPGQRRHQVIPRTLIFLTSVNPTTGGREVLLLKGAPTKRLWANRYNGLGGHVEADEDIHSAARRELREEAGIQVDRLTLRGIVHIQTSTDEQAPRPGVLVFVFHGVSPSREVQTTDEGTPEWIPVNALGSYPLVDDLYELIPRALRPGPIFFGHYRPLADGTMAYAFTEGGDDPG